MKSEFKAAQIMVLSKFYRIFAALVKAIRLTTRLCERCGLHAVLCGLLPAFLLGVPLVKRIQFREGIFFVHSLFTGLDDGNFQFIKYRASGLVWIGNARTGAINSRLGLIITS